MNQSQAAPADSTALWLKFAHIWKQLRPPLLPSKVDMEYLQKAVRQWQERHGAPRFLLMGVTQEVYQHLWSQVDDCLAVDLSLMMIRGVWPGGKKDVVCGDWTKLPLREGSRDVAFTDGGFLLLSPDQQKEFIQSMRRVLSPNGLVVLRMFAPALHGDSPEQVWNDVRSGEIPSRDVLKLRLFTAVQTDAVRGVSLHDLWTTVQSYEPELSRIALDRGWRTDDRDANLTWKDSPTRLYAVTREELVQLFCEAPGGFTLDHVDVPDYPGGVLCPTYVFRRA